MHEVFLNLQHTGLTVNPAKVKFASHHLSVLGHLFSPVRVTVDPARTLAIWNFSAPKVAEGIVCFIGMVNFFISLFRIWPFRLLHLMG